MIEGLTVSVAVIAGCAAVVAVIAVMDIVSGRHQRKIRCDCVPDRSSTGFTSPAILAALYSPMSADEKESSHIAARKGADHSRGTVNAEVIKVIRTVGMEGVGTKDDPCRYKIKYWSLEGKLLAVGCEEDDE